jgi:hypothetical protein
MVLQPVTEADSLERSAGGRPPLVERQPGVQEPVGGVVENGHTVQQEELLEHEPDVAGAQRGQLAIAQHRRVVPGDPDGALVRRVERADHVEQRRLSGARAAHDGQHLARGDGQADAAQGLDGWIAGIPLDDVRQLQDRRQRRCAQDVRSQAHTLGASTLRPSPMPGPEISTWPFEKMPV